MLLPYILSNQCVCIIPLTRCFFALDPQTGQSGTGQSWCSAGEATPQHRLRDLCACTARRVSKRFPERSRSHTYVVNKLMWVLGGIPDLQRADTHKPPCCSVPLPPAGQLRVRDVTHSTMNLDWDAAPGPVEKYLITYKPENGEAKEVSSCWFLSCSSRWSSQTQSWKTHIFSGRLPVPVLCSSYQS